VNLRLQHVAISRPPGSDAMARTFYGGVLGLVEIAPPTSLATLELIWFRLSEDTELHIMVEEPVGQDHSGRHFCLAVDDLVELRLRLEAAGITAVSDTPIPGRPRFFVRDPFGNLIEITSIEDDYRRLEVGIAHHPTE
jgi:catechol 2,3-dioxygenase-like lactoylglutathione lyase family enzyme